MEAQLSGFQRPQRMFMYRPQSQSFCDLELWEAGVIPSMWFPKPLNPRPIPAMNLDPVQVKLLGHNTIFRGTKG